jgi:hypothetical protein
VNNRLSSHCSVLYSGDRLIVMLIGSAIVFNVYMPCTGTQDRLALFEEILLDVACWRDKFPDYHCVLAGDFNVNLGLVNSDPIANCLSLFVSDQSLISSLSIHSSDDFVTYFNESTGHTNLLDYIFISSADNILDSLVFEPDVNFSDHMPLVSFVEFSNTVIFNNRDVFQNDSHANSTSVFLRWDYCDLSAYYELTHCELQPIFTHVIGVDSQTSCLSDDELFIQATSAIDNITSILINVSNQCVPCVRKNTFKYWWNEELQELKRCAIDSNVAWKAAGKPRSGPVFAARQSARLRYRKRIRECRRIENSRYGSKLHENLASKDSVSFWKAWRSKFGKADGCTMVDGSCDSKVVVDNFAKYFCSLNNPPVNCRDNDLAAEFNTLRCNYSNDFYIPSLVDAELVCNVLGSMKRGKAAGPDNLTGEHLLFCHPIVTVILAKVFNWLLLCSMVPESFCQSYIVPIPKNTDSIIRVATSCDFRGIAISSVLAKLFEACVLDIYGDFFATEDNQFGFKPKLGCLQAIYSANKFITSFINGGDTANVAGLDISKAFPRVNLHALLIKLMRRNIPVSLLNLLEFWLTRCTSRVKWRFNLSDSYLLRRGVNQGSVLAPILFAICINDVIRLCNSTGLGIILVYADDILLLTRTLHNLQRLFDVVQTELDWLNLELNASKSCWMRIGPRYDKACANIKTFDGKVIPRVSEIRYLGIYMQSCCRFKCSYAHAKRSFNRAANCIFGRLLGNSPEDVIVFLLKSKCLPILLYGAEACSLNNADLQSLDFSLIRFGMKLFKSSNRQLVLDCFSYFGLLLPSVLVPARVVKFKAKLAILDNSVCRYVSLL